MNQPTIKAKPRLLAFQEVRYSKQNTSCNSPSKNAISISPSKMSEEEKMDFKNKLIREGNEISDRIDD